MEKHVDREKLADLIGDVAGWEIHRPSPLAPVPLASVAYGADGLVLTDGAGAIETIGVLGLKVLDVSRAFCDAPEKIAIIEEDLGDIDLDTYRVYREPSSTLLATLRHDARIAANDAKEAELKRRRAEEAARRDAEHEAERALHLKTFDETRVAPLAAGLIGRTIAGVEVRHPRVILTLDDGSKFELESQEVLLGGVGGMTGAFIAAKHGGRELNTYASVHWPRISKKR